jgi:hypothetical protein
VWTADRPEKAGLAAKAEEMHYAAAGQITGRPVFCLRGIPTDSGLVSNFRGRLM